MPPITKPVAYQITEQRSRFLAEARPAASMADIKQVVAAKRKNLRKANHHVWACRFHDERGRLVEQARDDGEVGRPGMALLELLRHDDLEGMLIVSRIIRRRQTGPRGCETGVSGGWERGPESRRLG